MAIQTIQVDLQRIVDKTKRKLETVVEQFAQDLAEELVRTTPGPGNSIQTPPIEPPLTGFLRGSWYLSLNNPSGANQGKEDPSGATTVAAMAAGSGAADIGDTLYFLNNAEYAKYLEYGTSKMAPRAWVRSTVARAPLIADETIRKIAVT